MDFLMLAKPTGFWSNIIFAFEGWLGSYILGVILITVLIKLVLLPFDVYNKYTAKKNARVQAVLAPEIEKIKKQYQNNPQMENQKTMELYKRENHSVMGTCLGMLVYMALTLVVFFTLLSSFNTIASYKIYDEYTAMRTAYQLEYDNSLEANHDKENKEELATKDAQIAVINKYSEIKTGFLWIKNIWRPDTSASIVLKYNEFTSLTKHLKIDEDNKVEEEEYNKIVTESFKLPQAKEYQGWNGYFLISILSALLTYGSLQLTTFLGKRKAKKQNKEYLQGPEANKAMSLIMPLIMGAFTLFYNSAFGIYIVVGAVVAFLTGPLVNIVVDKIDDKVQHDIEMKRTASYSRTKREM